MSDAKPISIITTASGICTPEGVAADRLAARLKDALLKQGATAAPTPSRFGDPAFTVYVIGTHASKLPARAIAARHQLLEDRHDLAILVRVEPDGRQPVVIVTPEGGKFPFGAVDETVIGALADLIMRRRAAVPVPLVEDSREQALASGHQAYRHASILLDTAQQASMFSGTSGNLSVRVSERNDLLISPTGADKTRLLVHELAYVGPIDEAGQHHYWGARPSIDTSLQARLYADFPEITALLHLHADAGTFLTTDASTSFPYPCGTREEADEAARALRQLRPDQIADGFNLKLAHHGYLLGFAPGGMARFRREWHAALVGLNEDAIASGMDQVEAAELMAAPIFLSSRVIGAAGYASDGYEIVHVSTPWNTDETQLLLEKIENDFCTA